MSIRKTTENDARTTRGGSREAGVRAALRARRRRRADEADLQSLVRRLSTQASAARGR